MICGIWVRHDGVTSIALRSAMMDMNSYRNALSWTPLAQHGAPESSNRVVDRSPPLTGTPHIVGILKHVWTL